MFADNLYQHALLDPLLSDTNLLIVVSGYASATMASKHVKDILEVRDSFKINLVVGMCPEEGIDLFNHRGFLALSTSELKVRFECQYVYERPPVHSKLYIWCSDSKPILAFTGSANYTQQAFSGNQCEILVLCDPQKAYDYYSAVESRSIYCTHGELEDYVVIRRPSRKDGTSSDSMEESDEARSIMRAEKVTLSLLQRGGEVGMRSGLNWGQREGREPNQAYIPLPSHISRRGFFPSGGTHFTVITDDNKLLIMRVEQQNDKAITTPLNNSLLGEYFRNRLGLSSGHFITTKHLESYGRISVDFYKIDDETFFMDFSKPVW